MKCLPLHNPHFIELLEDFKRYVVAKEYSNGENLYVPMVREFLFYCETSQLEHISQVKSTHVIGYYDYLCIRPNQRRPGALSGSAIKQRLYSLRLFFDHLLDCGHLDSSPVHIPKFILPGYNPRNIATVDEIRLMYDACKTKRDRALLGLAYACGLRRKEIERLNVNSIDFFGGELTVRFGKNGKTRTVPITQSVVKDLREYMVNERDKNLIRYHKQSPAFLINKYGDRPQGQTLHNRIKEILKRTGNAELMRKNICLHGLRHSISTHLQDAGASIEFVSDFLGHQELDTTHLYSKRRRMKLIVRQAVERSDRSFRAKKKVLEQERE